jgi:hypothetical protein
MSLTPLQRNRQQRTERLRGWIVKVLYESRPDPMEMVVLSSTLDEVNFGVSRRALGMEVDFLRSLSLVRVFPLGSDDELDKVAQAKLLQRFCNSDSDGEMNLVLCATLSYKGINFQEGMEEHPGVSRVR